MSKAIVIDDDLHRDLKIRAAQESKTIAELVAEAVAALKASEKARHERDKKIADEKEQQ